MIPFSTTTRAETAANRLLDHFRHVLVQAYYDNNDAQRIRFRADLVTHPRVYFGKVPSQIRQWRKTGGLLISWRRVDAKEGPHDALLFMECPKSIEGMYKGAHLTRHLAVIYVPPTWRVHEDTIIGRHKNAHPSKFQRQMKRLEIVRDYVKSLPVLTQIYLARQQRARAAQAQSSSSFSPSPPADAAPPAYTPR